MYLGESCVSMVRIVKISKNGGKHLQNRQPLHLYGSTVAPYLHVQYSINMISCIVCSHHMHI